MKEQKRIDLNLTGIDEIFMSHEERADRLLPKIQPKPLDLIDPFEEHPFKVEKDEDMLQLIESIREFGVITPVILRTKKDGRYELISGHRRVFACRELGFDTIPAEIRNMDRDEAIIFMVDSNLQRSRILPSEKAFSYKMRLEAMKRQAGRPKRENYVPVEHNYDGKSARKVLAEVSVESEAQIQRYIRLTNLIPSILELVDNGEIALRPAVELSYLSEIEQKNLFAIMQSFMATPSYTQAIALRKISKDGNLKESVIKEIMSEKKPNQKERLILRADSLKKYLPKGYTDKQAEEYIIKALTYYNRSLNRQKER